MKEAEIIKNLKSMIEQYLPALKANNNSNNIMEGLFCSVNTRTNTVVKVLTQVEWDLFYSPIQFMLSQKDISNNYSEEFVQSKFVELYHKILDNEPNMIIDTENLTNFFLNNTVKTFLVISEVENIRILDDQEYEIIDSIIKMMKQEDLLNKGKGFKLLSEKLVDKPTISTKVQAGDYDKAVQLATHNFMISFNLLKLYAPSFKPALKGYLSPRVRGLVAYNETDKVPDASASLIGDALLNRAYLNNQLYKQLINAGISELRKTNTISKNTISKVVKDCLYWFGLGLEEEYPSAKLLNFVMVLESALKRKDEITELKKAVSERGAILLYDKFEERKKAAKELKRIYDLRSKVVHTGTLIGDKDFVFLSGAYVKAVLRKLIKMSKCFNCDFDKFITYLDDMKLKGEINNASDND
ncbi:MAG: HEPN domain-containing protein [bacterium]|nr:HEPN domain-containing protein [bacterium]